MAGTFVAHMGCKRAGLVSSGILFLTFLNFTCCSLPELCAWIERMIGEREHFNSLHNGVSCAAFLLWFFAISAETLLLCFANLRDEPLSDDPNHSPELDSSFINRITLW